MTHRGVVEAALDPGIRQYVETLVGADVETFESCEGGEGHTFSEPTIRFHGQRDEGFRALAVALQHAFPVSNLRRVWSIEDGEPVGPNWELTFYRQAGVCSGVSGPITDALVTQGLATDPDTFHCLPWRKGRKVGRTIYVQAGSAASDDDVLIGVMDTSRLAEEAVAAHNAVLAQVQALSDDERTR